MHQKICDYHRDEIGDWVAELSCGHYQHVRHNPPWVMREWVTSQAGRAEKIGEALNCKKCDEGQAPNAPTSRQKTHHQS